MDLLDLYKMIGSCFIKLCNVHFTVGGLDFTVGSVFLFCLVASLIIWFLRGLADG